MLEYAAGAATVAVGWAGYFNRVMQGFGIALPDSLTAAYFANAHSIGGTHGIFNVPAAAIVLLLTALLMRGTSKSRSSTTSLSSLR